MKYDRGNRRFPHGDWKSKTNPRQPQVIAPRVIDPSASPWSGIAQDNEKVQSDETREPKAVRACNRECSTGLFAELWAPPQSSVPEVPEEFPEQPVALQSSKPPVSNDRKLSRKNKGGQQVVVKARAKNSAKPKMAPRIAPKVEQMEAVAAAEPNGSQASDDDALSTPGSSPRGEGTPPPQIAARNGVSPSKTTAPPKGVVPLLSLSNLKPHAAAAQKPAPNASSDVEKPEQINTGRMKPTSIKTLDLNEVKPYYDIGSPKTTRGQQRRRWRCYLRLVSRHKNAVASGNDKLAQHLEEVIRRAEIPKMPNGEDEVWAHDWAESGGDIQCLTERLKKLEINDEFGERDDVEVNQADPEDELWDIDWSRLPATAR